MALAAALPEDADAPTYEIDVLTLDADDFRHPDACHDHQSDGKKRGPVERLVGTYEGEIVGLCGGAQGAQEATEVVSGEGARECAGATHRKGHTGPRIGRQCALLNQPLEKTSKSGDATSDRWRTEPPGALLFNEGNKASASELSYDRLIAEVPFQRTDVARVCADGVT
jgi:hypothetical protein